MEEQGAVTQENPENEVLNSDSGRESSNENEVELVNNQTNDVESNSVQEELEKMGRTITGVVNILRTKNGEGIIRILNQQPEPTIFLTQL